MRRKEFRTRGVLVALAVLLALALVPGQAQSADCSSGPCVATDGGDSITLPDPATDVGINNWDDDGTDHFFNDGPQWFWFRIGDPGTGELSLDTLTLDSADATDDVITLNYSDSDLAVTVVYDLDDLGVGRSRIREIVSI